MKNELYLQKTVVCILSIYEKGEESYTRTRIKFKVSEEEVKKAISAKEMLGGNLVVEYLPFPCDCFPRRTIFTDPEGGIIVERRFRYFWFFLLSFLKAVLGAVLLYFWLYLICIAD